MTGFTLNHLRHYWHSDLAVLVCLTLASTLLVGLYGYTANISQKELYQTITIVSPGDRSLLLTGTSYALNETLFENIQTRLGELFRERLEIRHTTLEADPQQAIDRIEVYSIDQLARHVRLIEGSLPEQIRLSDAAGSWPPSVEAVISVRAARMSGYGIGDRITATGLYHRLDIVGIVEPLDANDDVWGGDPSAFEPVTETLDTGPGLRSLPLIIASTSMRSYLDRPLFPHELSWRITLDIKHIRPERVESLQSNLINLQAQSSTSDIMLDTGMIKILADYRARLSPVRMVFFLLILQTLIVVVFILTMFSSSRIERSRVELETLSARGISFWQITCLFALRDLSFSILSSLIFGPILAQTLIYVWSIRAGEIVPFVLPGEAWLLSGLVGGTAWVVLVVPILLATRHGRSILQLTGFCLPQQSFIYQHYLDLYFFALGGLLFWQLNQSGSFLMQKLEDIQSADPLLLVGPSLLMVASIMVVIRSLPILVWPAARISEHLQGLVLQLGLYRLARDPLQSGRMFLLVSLTTGLVVFNRLSGDIFASSKGLRLTDSLVKGIGNVFNFNTLTLILFSMVVFYLLHIFITRRWMHEFKILSIIGLTKPQGLFTLVVECIPMLVMGLLVGSALGLGFFFISIPYLLQAFGSAHLGQLRVNWLIVVQLCVLLFFAYGSALSLSLISLCVQWRQNLLEKPE